MVLTRTQKEALAREKKNLKTLKRVFGSRAKIRVRGKFEPKKKGRTLTISEREQEISQTIKGRAPIITGVTAEIIKQPKPEIKTVDTTKFGPRISRLPKREQLREQARRLASGIVRAQPKPKTLIEKLAKKRSEERSEGVKGKRSSEVKQVGLGLLIGVSRGVKSAKDSLVEFIRNPVRTTKETIKTGAKIIRNPSKELIQPLGKFIREDPIVGITQITVDFVAFNKALGLTGRAIKKNPVARVIQEERFIRAQPKPKQKIVRAVLEANRIQEKIVPVKLQEIKRVSFTDVANLNRAQAKALLKAQKNTGGVLFGSKASRILTKGKTKVPKDIDLAVKDIDAFNKDFLKNLPKSEKVKLKIKNQKIVDKFTGDTIADVKPVGRLRPDFNILTGKAQLPVAGFKTRIKLDLKKGSFLPKLEKQLQQGILEVPTQRTQKVAGIKVVSFGEQTTRKGLGTLQVLLERNTRRAKDPTAFIESLKIQSKTIKNRGGPINNIKSKLLNDRIKILEDKFIKRKGPTRVKKKKISKPKSRKGSTIERLKLAKKKLTKVKKKVTKGKPKPKKIDKKPSRMPSKVPKKLKVSKVPSRITKRKKPSRIPSKVPSRIPISKIPSKIPSKVPTSRIPPSRPPSKPPSRIPPSKPPSRIPPSKPPSRIPPSRPPSRIPPSKPPSKIPPKKPKKKPKPKKKIKKFGKPKLEIKLFTPTIVRPKKRKKELFTVFTVKQTGLELR